jgi:hypothetical protein
MVTRRDLLFAIGFTIAALLAPATIGAAQKAPKPRSVTVTLKVDGMT